LRRGKGDKGEKGTRGKRGQQGGKRDIQHFTCPTNLDVPFPSTKPYLSPSCNALAITPGIRIVACADYESQESLALRLHLGESESTILRLGIDGGNNAYTPTFDRGGRRLAWGQDDGIVCVCDLDEVLRRLKAVGLE
jgi:hypothetical protein